MNNMDQYPTNWMFKKSAFTTYLVSCSHVKNLPKDKTKKAGEFRLLITDSTGQNQLTGKMTPQSGAQLVLSDPKVTVQISAQLARNLAYSLGVRVDGQSAGSGCFSDDCFILGHYMCSESLKYVSRVDTRKEYCRSRELLLIDFFCPPRKCISNTFNICELIKKSRLNSRRFSSCSLTQLKTIYNSTTFLPTSPVGASRPMQVVPLSLDDQCRAVHGPSYRYCGGQAFIKTNRVCNGLFCAKLNSKRCTKTYIYPEIMSHCGNRMWCEPTGCEENKAAPKLADCQYGDGPSCSIYKRRPDQCRNDVLKEHCCETCARKKDARTAG